LRIIAVAESSKPQASSPAPPLSVEKSRASSPRPAADPEIESLRKLTARPVPDFLPKGLAASGYENDRGIRSELDDMLRTAEHLQEKCDRTSTVLQGVIFAAVLGGAALTALFYANANAFGRPQMITVTTLLGLLSGWSVGMTFNMARRRLRRDRRALHAIIRLLRETQSVFLSNDVMTPFEKAQFEIRMSRLETESSPVEEKVRTATM
jgi:hypothetical protein